MRSCDLRIEQADRRGRETERRHRRELGRLHDTAEGHADRPLQLVQRRDRVVVGRGGDLHGQELSRRFGALAPRAAGA